MGSSIYHDRRGFTLVELVTIMVIIGILAAYVMPRLFSLTAFTSRGYFDQLIQATRYAEKLAVTSGCAVRITINPSNFSLQQPAAAPTASQAAWNNCTTGANWGMTVMLPGTDTSPYSAPSNVTVGVIATGGGATSDIVFLPKGVADNGYTVTVTDTTDGSTHIFKVYQDTGYVQRQ